MISPETLIVVGIGALIIFGPRKLPELGKSLGQGLREFKRGTAGLTEELRESFKDEPHAPAQVSVTPETPRPEVIRVEPSAAAAASVQPTADHVSAPGERPLSS